MSHKMGTKNLRNPIILTLPGGWLGSLSFEMIGLPLKSVLFFDTSELR
jgi:hypothetical protein